ncbi:hypothetical protein H2203_002962 [Taxawa tesnikishii (nom. ined.)]|nr:hypothetical protein H2203_002962 [Dothideales sp. JES 119]
MFRRHCNAGSSAVAQAALDAQTSYLHHLIPATSSNPNLCKLLLSSAILNYPTPIFINWGAHEAADAYKQHIQKIETILAYMETITPKTEQDLVLIVDGFDVWYQLRPDVMLKRYYAMNAVADQIAREAYGEELFQAHNITQTVIFGPDKICWPIDYRRPACWTMPNGPVDQYAFGPDTDYELEEHNIPRWLNSGTILGPIEDVREVFRATLAKVRANHTTDSDQFYFANVMGDQEYARLARVPELLKEKMAEKYEGDNKTEPHPQRDSPIIEAGSKTEYHIGLDLEALMFQTMAYYRQFLVWMSYNNSWRSSAPNQERYNYVLPQDVVESAPPFQAVNLSPDAPHDTAVYNQSWEEQNLLVNQLRDLWWHKLWFFPEAEALRKASTKMVPGFLSESLIGGRMWKGAEKEESMELIMAGRGGGWSDEKEAQWLSWNKLCGKHEADIYSDRRPGKH